MRASATMALVAAGFYHLSAQSLDDLMFTVGTTANIPGHGSYGYVVLQSQETEAVIGRPYAIYEKQAPFSGSATFQLRAVVQLQQNPETIRSILNASRLIDGEFDELEGRVNAYYEDLDISMIGGSGGEPDLAEKISLAVRSAKAQPELFERLYLLGRLHPGMNCVLGLAYFGPIPNGDLTWELRGWNPSSGTPEEVVGRVLLNAGDVEAGLNYLPLPAPGKPVDVPFPVSDTVYENDPRGHLNVRLRWWTPDKLRSRSLLALGYNLYRMPAAVAVDLGLASEGDLECRAPSQKDLSFFLDGGLLEQVNRYPIITEEDLSEAEAYNDTDTDTYFTADDDDRFDPAQSAAFEDGDEFYYFVSAEDLLRRPGYLSDGHYVMICDRQPPLPVEDVVVANHFEAPTDAATLSSFGGPQCLKVSWRPLSIEDPALNKYNYYIYRWTSTDEMLAKSADPTANLVGGPIRHVPDASLMSWLDQPTVENPEAPQLPQDASRTYYYTVRAEDASACGGNLSANSAPAYGVLRDRRPLGTPKGNVRTRCVEVEIKVLGQVSYTLGEEGAPANAVFTVVVTRDNPDIEWVELRASYVDAGASQGLNTVDLGRVYFAEGVDEVVYYTNHTSKSDQDVTFYARGGDRYGKTSSVLSTTLGSRGPNSDRGTKLTLNLLHEAQFTFTRECGPHVAIDRFVLGGGIVGIRGSLQLLPRTVSYFIYRRVDDGELTLIEEGEGLYAEGTLESIEFEDTALPATPYSRICYYGMLQDRHGNSSPMVRLGDCIEVVREFESPLLAAPEPAESGDAQMATLRWFGAPDGVDRYEVWISASNGVDPADIGPDLERLEFLGDSTRREDDLVYYRYQTQRLASGFGQQAPEFSVDVELDPNLTYTIVVRPVGPGEFDGRLVGPFSNAQSLAWTEGPEPKGPYMDWPDRDLPGVSPGAPDASRYTGALQMVLLPDNHGLPVPALLLGTFRLIDPAINQPILENPESHPGDGEPEFLMPAGDPMISVVKRIVARSTAFPDGEQSIFPFALYRYRVDAPIHRGMTNTVEQVTPMMRSIAYQGGVNYDNSKDGGSGVAVSRVRDPYFYTRLFDTFNPSGPTHYLFMLDYHPVQVEGTYQYLMVLFTDRGEIDTVVPLNQITIQ